MRSTAQPVLNDKEFNEQYEGMLANVRLKIATFLNIENLTAAFNEDDLDFKDTSEQMQAKIIWNVIYQLNQIKSYPKTNVISLLADALRKDEISLVKALRYIKENVREPFMPAAASLFELITHNINQFLSIMFENAKIWLPFAGKVGIESTVTSQLEKLKAADKIPTADLTDLVKNQINKILASYYSTRKLKEEEQANIIETTVNIDGMDFEEMAEEKPVSTTGNISDSDTADTADSNEPIQMDASQDIPSETSQAVPVQEKLDSFNTFKKHKKRAESKSKSFESDSESSTQSESGSFESDKSQPDTAYPTSFKTKSFSSKDKSDSFVIYFEALATGAAQLLVDSNQLLRLSNQPSFSPNEENNRLLRDCQQRIRSLENDMNTLEKMAEKRKYNINQDTIDYIEQSIKNAQQNCSRYDEKVNRKILANACSDMINTYYKNRCQDYKHYDNVAKIGVFFAQCFKPDYQTDRKEIAQFLLRFDSALRTFVATGKSADIRALVQEGRANSQSRTSDKNNPAYRHTRQSLFDQIEILFKQNKMDTEITPSL